MVSFWTTSIMRSIQNFYQNIQYMSLQIFFKKNQIK